MKASPGRPRTSISWSDLPKELLQAIATRLSTQGQIRHFRSVCKTWRQSVAPPTPLSHPPLKISFSDDASNSFFLGSQTGSLVPFSVCLLRPNEKPNTVTPWLATVEELSPGKAHLRKPLSRTLIQYLPRYLPGVLDLSQFHVTEVFKGYYLRLDNYYHLKQMFTEHTLSKFEITKVLLISNPNSNSESPATGDCIMVILDKHRSLHAVRLREGQKPEFVPISGFREYTMGSQMVHDIVSFMGKVYAIDHRGRVFVIRYNNSRLKARTLVDELPHSLLEPGNRRKKWLVESSGRLYLVHRCSGNKVKFEVYELDFELRCWKLLDTLGEDRMLFVTCDGCFFLSVEDLPPGFEGNCIIFYRGCFYSKCAFGDHDSHIFKSVRGWKKGSELGIAVYFYDNSEYGICKPVSSEYAKLLWPPPTWLAPHPCSSRWSSEKEKIMSGSKTHNEHVALNHDVSSEYSSFAEPEDEVQGAEVAPSSPSLTGLCTHEQTLINSEHVYEEETHGEVQDDSTSKASTSRTETSRTFEELNVRSDLVPTLRKIWAKHGNIIEGSVVHNGDILARALESLATVVETLQSSSGWSLEDSQADYMSSALLDLKHMQINVDWLTPSVEKALALHKSKPLIKTLAEINKAKANYQEMRRKLQDELAKVEGKEKLLEEQSIHVSRKIPVSGEIDMDGCLGDGLC